MDKETVQGGTFTMSDEISQAAETEQVSSDEAQVRESEVAESTTQEEPQKEKPLTAEDYRRIAREEATRVAQSQMAKSENRIQRSIQEKFRALEESKDVLRLTPEQLKQARQDIVTQAYSEEPEAGAETNASPNGQDVVQQQVEFVYSQVDETLRDLGVVLNPSDPEYALVNNALSDPNGSLAKTIRATVKAGEAKLKRLAQKKDTAKARVGGGGEQGTNTTKPKTPEEKISMGLKNSSWPTQTPQK